MTDNHDIDGFLGTSDDGLQPEEKAQSWQRIRQHMEQHQTSSEEAFAASFFAPAASASLTKDERNDIRVALTADRDAHAFFAAAQDVSLGALERQSVLSGILGGQKARQTLVSRQERLTLSFVRWLAPVLGVFFLAAGGVGISYAAEDAVPGEFLYPIKRVSEHLEAQFNFGTEAKAEAETTRMERRMLEAKRLQETARLTESVSMTLDQEFRVERRDVNQHIQELEQDGKVEAAAKLRARLNATEDAYRRYFERAADSSSSAPERKYPTLVEPIVSEVLENTVSSSDSSRTRVNIRTNGSAKVSVETRGNADVRVESHSETRTMTAEEEAAVKAAADIQVQEALKNANQMQQDALSGAGELGADIQAQVQAELEGMGQ